MARHLIRTISLNSTRNQHAKTQNYFLIWVDENINTKDKDCRNTLAHLKILIKEVHLCTTAGQCMNILNDVFEEKVFIISSGKLMKQLIPEIHDMPCVDVVYIFCQDKSVHENWINQWHKIRGVFTSVKPMYDSLKEFARTCDHDAIPISLVPKRTPTGSIPDQETLKQLPSTFMYSIVFQEIVLEIEDDNDEKSMDDFIAYCSQQNILEDELHNFQRIYQNYSPIYVYTSEMFFYRMLNCALWNLDTRTITKLGFFIRKLHRQLETLHNQQKATLNENFTVYRGQGFTPAALQQLIDSKGGLLSFNTFLSTSRKQDVAMAFVRHALDKKTNIAVLFIMTIDPIKLYNSNTPYANIDNYSAVPQEKEILFSMHTVFKINDVKVAANNNRLWEVRLTLTDNNDPQLADLIHYIRQETAAPNGWHRLAQLMHLLGDFSQAEELYKYFFEESSNDGERAHLYHQLGCLKNKQGEYREAVKYYENSLELKRKGLSADHSTLAPTYHQLGLVYDNIGDYFKALGYYEKSHEIYEKVLPSNHPLLATSYNNIASVYCNLGHYSKALQYYDKSHAIFVKSLPSNHPDLATSLNNIGLVYKNKGDFSKALEYYEKALNIREKSLPLNHPDFAQSYNNIAGVYFNLKEYSKSLAYYEQALNLWQQTLPTAHPNIKTVKSNIDFLKKKM